MVSSGRGRLFRRKDGKYLLYLPVYLCEDSMFPFSQDYAKGSRGAPGSINVKISFKIGGEKQLIVEPWPEESGSDHEHSTA